MRKFFIILTGTLFTFLFTACKQFTADIDDYLSYWSAEAFVTGHNIGSAHRADGAGVQCVGSSADTLIALTAHNPKNLTLSNPAGIVEFKGLSTQPAAGTDYELKQTGSGTLELTYKESFLQKYGQGSADLNPTITLKAQDGRVFKQTYTFGIKSNSPPPKPEVVFAKTNRPPYHYVLCLKFDPDEMRRTVTADSVTVPAHKDIAGITINNNSYALSYKDDNSDFKKPAETNPIGSFIGSGEVAQLTTPPLGAWVLYFKTGVGVETVGEATLHTITLRDKAGVVSDSVTAELKEKFKVEFNAKGGSPVPPDQYIEIGGLAAEPQPQPAREGYTFGGWYKDNDCSNGQEWDFGNHTVTQNIILYAKWNVKSGIPYKVEHYKEELDGTYPTASHIDDLTGTTEAPLSVGSGITLRTYQGFRYDNRLEPASPKISGDGHTVVKVYYKRETYTVNFSVDGSGGHIETDVTGGTDAPPTESSITVKFGGSVTFTAKPDLGWEVDHWTGAMENTPNTTATLSNVTGPKNVKVKFKKITTVNAGDGAWKLLREVVRIADNNATITINGEIKATPTSGNNGEIVINKNLTIKGKTGASLDKLNAITLSRIFKVKTGNTLTLENITLKNGKADNGGGVYNEGTLIMKGSATVAPSAGAGKNDVYLASGAMIIVNSTLSPTDGIAAYITPGSYAEGRQVLNGSGVGSGYYKFEVTPESSTAEWVIKSDGYLKKAKDVVSSSSATPWKDLNTAITSAQDGDIIVINGEIKATNAPDNYGGITINKSITIKGKNKDTAILNANKDENGKFTHYIFFVNKTVTLQNLTLTGGINGNGGAIHIGASTHGNTVEMINCIIKDNTATGDGGGGVYIGSNGTFTMDGESSSITGNFVNGTGTGFAVYIDEDGTFNWIKGSISSNGGSDKAVHKDPDGTFTNTSGNTAY